MLRNAIKSYGVGLLLFAVPAMGSPVIDGINQNAQPARSFNTIVQFTMKDIGWYYTPSFSYELDGIYSRFQNMSEVSTSPDLTKTLTVQIQSERPVNGGSVLGQADFNVRTLDGGYLGGTFAPVHLEAGTTYFIDYLNVENVGINLATWANDGSGNPKPAGGATVNLGGFYRNLGTDTNFANVGSAYGVSSPGNVNVAGGEPILFFTGTILPEPSSMIGILGTSILLLKRTRKTHLS